tara:strand:- start:207 stop:347 length:141 start_codon:yes stop_codon:yes gene_type:complete
VYIESIFTIQEVKKAKEIILMTLNMGYGLFGTGMEINNLEIISKRI